MTTLPDIVSVLGRPADGIQATLRMHGLELKPSEAQKLCGLLGRDPTRAEAFLFDVAWSEHCSYKSSRAALSTFFSGHPSHVVLGPGEDAGVVKFTTWNDEQYCLVMSHESHNHPSQVLPVEGAATGIGGIVRDVYCMGADVIGVLDALRFGDPSVPKCAEIARGVVEGIWQYGNALGVPNLGGDVYFEKRFNENCLVNVIALGLVKQDRIIRSRVPTAATKEPYVAILVGKPTDSSGLGGASFASADLEDADAERNIGAVQVADPFLKRVLAEANRVILDEMHDAGVEIGFKDLGAGGIGGATVELAASGNMGVTIDCDRVRVAEADLGPEVILIAETQERFVWAIPERLAERVIEIYERDFQLPQLYPGAGATVLGPFRDDGMVVVRHDGKEVVRCRAADLTEGLSYDRKATPPEIVERARPVRPAAQLDEIIERFHEILAHPDGASRAYIYRHYDPEVRGATVLRPGEGDASVIAPIPGCPTGVAIAVEGNPHRGEEDPFEAGAWAVAGAMRNVATTGGSPIALSDCLNFGNPERPEVFWAFREAVRGIAETAEAIGMPSHPDTAIPIITGNVSFYNQSAGGSAIPSTPIVACIGTVKDVRRIRDISVKIPGNRLLWAGRFDDALGGTLFARVADLEFSTPRLDVAVERALISTLVELADDASITAAHDVSEGGLLTAVFEMLAASLDRGGLGAEIDLSALPEANSPEVAAFSEAGAVVLEVTPEHADDVCRRFRAAGVSAAVFGEVLDRQVFNVCGRAGESHEIDLRRTVRIWEEGLQRWLS